MFCHLYWFAAATEGKLFLFWNSNIYPNPQCKIYAIESESDDFLAGLPFLINIYIRGGGLGGKKTNKITGREMLIVIERLNSD